MIKFSETNAPTNADAIGAVEAKLNLILPNAYISHLLKENGGRCSPNVFSFIERGKKANSSIEWFLALYDGKYNNLNDYIDTYKLSHKRLPFHMFPIANDGSGNLICISCGADDYGYVYFWDHDIEVDYDTSNDNDYSNLYLIAKGFDEFLNGLRMTV